MLVSVFHKQKVASPLHIASKTTEKQTAAGQRKFLSSIIFEISFRYLKNAVRLKVLKVGYGRGEYIYKIVLNSSLSKWTNMCWLQRRVHNWVVLLGHEPGVKLKQAITSAIEHHECKA
jgi:hypothetical protein